ncbi:MAG: lipocalin family protein [Patescibacteria group bacterium]|nr:lipocalin family protein [Patescibacteria group bacterium]MDD5490645.1 lipocalin family protein [Patescibacteria group bacterium]
MLFAPVRGIIGPVELPQDDSFLPEEDVQWWYWTGHLQTEEGKKFGFEICFFTFDSLFVFKDQLIQAAITDVDDNSFHFKEYVRTFSLPEELPSKFDLSSGKGNKVTASGSGGYDTLHSEVDGYVLDLKLEPTKSDVVHYEGGPHVYRSGGFTYYYSRVGMETAGTISVNGKTYNVTGTSWFDRQYGELYQAIQKGWQWFAIELDDNRQIMLYDINGAKDRIESYVSITDATGETKDLHQNDFTVTILDHWKSPHTGILYPSGWKLNVAGEEWIVEPMVKDQELRAQHHFWVGPDYWEGACTVKDSSGKNIGKAYVELNGFKKK